MLWCVRVLAGRWLSPKTTSTLGLLGILRSLHVGLRRRLGQQFDAEETHVNPQRILQVVAICEPGIFSSDAMHGSKTCACHHRLSRGSGCRNCNQVRVV